MEQSELIEALSLDSILGYIPLNTNFFQAKVKNCIELMMQQPDPSIYFGENRKIKMSRRFATREKPSPVEMPLNQPWLRLGSGVETVYAIFSDSTMNRYVEAGLSKFPIKIGRTSRPVENRIQELQTGNYLNLRIGIQFSTNKSRELENEIHKHLGHMRVISRGSSSEWFYSNLEEIRDIYLNSLIRSEVHKF
ncbi:Bacteriophage T5, Orf172 DNA-binding [Candidatus Nanopelagicaceae bacterium]